MKATVALIAVEDNFSKVYKQTLTTLNSYTIICNNPGLITNPNPQLSAVKCSSEWAERLTSSVLKKEADGVWRDHSGITQRPDQWGQIPRIRRYRQL